MGGDLNYTVFKIFGVEISTVFKIPVFGLFLFKRGQDLGHSENAIMQELNSLDLIQTFEFKKFMLRFRSKLMCSKESSIQIY